MTGFEHNAQQTLVEGAAAVPSVSSIPGALRLQFEAPQTQSIQTMVDQVTDASSQGLVGRVVERTREAYEAQANPNDLSQIARLSRTALGIIDDTRWQAFLAHAAQTGESKVEATEKRAFRTELARRIRQMPGDTWKNAGADAILAAEQLAIREYTESGLLYEPLTPLQGQERLIAVLKELQSSREAKMERGIEEFAETLRDLNDPELTAKFNAAFGLPPAGEIVSSTEVSAQTVLSRQTLRIVTKEQPIISASDQQVA